MSLVCLCLFLLLGGQPASDKWGSQLKVMAPYNDEAYPRAWHLCGAGEPGVCVFVSNLFCHEASLSASFTIIIIQVCDWRLINTEKWSHIESGMTSFQQKLKIWTLSL